LINAFDTQFSGVYGLREAAEEIDRLKYQVKMREENAAKLTRSANALQSQVKRKAIF